MGIGPGGPLHKWLKYNVLSLCTFPSLPFPFLSFLVVAYSKNGWTYLIEQYIKRQGCGFWGEKI